ncbi:CoA transferase [Vreelandella subglaciescola]|uniref:CoA transferase n=1 Tax=Vreelandella subglaciescola TaxID=29571 RepID=UPI0018D2D1E4
MDQVFDDPHVKARQLKHTLPYPQAGQVNWVSNPIRFNDIALNADIPPPGLGQHTDQILENMLQLDAQQIATLKQQGII